MARRVHSRTALLDRFLWARQQAETLLREVLGGEPHPGSVTEEAGRLEWELLYGRGGGDTEAGRAEALRARRAHHMLPVTAG